MNATDEKEIAEVNAFWRKAGPDAWFRKDAAFDDRFRETLRALHWRAARRELDHWNATSEGALALMILLDQYPRNCFRGTAHMFATDPLARYYARQSVTAGLDRDVEPALRAFLYLPFEHSEDISDQERAMDLFAPLGEEMVKYAVIHHDIIRNFGRFPHRNPLLGRESTPEELQFLAGGGFAG